MLLLAIEELITDEAEQSLAELRLGELLEAAEVEHLEGRHASEIDAVGKVHLELLHLLFKIDLIQEELRHLPSYLAARAFTFLCSPLFLLR